MENELSKILLIFIITGVIAAIIPFQARSFTTTPKRKVAVLLPILYFLGLAYVIPLAFIDPRYAALFIAGVMAIAGIIFSAVFDESAALFVFLRSKYVIWRILIPTVVAPRATMLFNGIAMSTLGSAAFIYFLFLLLST
jgi:uncharacterized membrane protein